MRTRFLNIDYFNPSSSSTNTLEKFLHLPLPHLPPPSSPLSGSEEDELLRRRCFDSALPVISVDVDLPIDGALSKFFSDVLPQLIDVRIAEFSDDLLDDATQVSEKGSEVNNKEKELERKKMVGSESVETELPKKENETTIDGKDGHEFEAVQFEEPHLDLFLIDDCFSEQKGMHLLSEVPEAKINPDMLLSELQMQYPSEVQESVYSVENVTSEYRMDEDSYLLEDAGSVQDQNSFHNCTFPILEVGEISLGISLGRSVEDEFHSLVENIELQNFTQKDLKVDGKELVDSVEINLLENFPDPCLKQSLESEMACLNMFLEKDYISITKSSNGQGNLEFHEGTSDGESYVSVSPILFQEIQIFDVDSSQCSEIFSEHPAIDRPETCDPMLMEDMNLKSFNELVVSHELALADDTFKSLPVPIFSNHESIKSLYDNAEEILEDMKPQPLSSTDGIYLDWHLLDEDKCNYQNMLDDIINFSIDFDLKSIDDNQFILNFVFSEDTLNKPDMGESKESLNMLPVDLYTLDAQFTGVGSTKKLEMRCPKPENEELLVESKAERVSLLFESMSQFSDLDFFLNPQKATAGGNSESVVKTFNAKATVPMVQSGESSTEKLELEECSVPNAFCEGRDIPQKAGFVTEGQSHRFQGLDENRNGQKLKEPPNSIPMKHTNTLWSSEAADSLEACSMPLPNPSVPLNMNSKQIQSSMSSFPDKVIIVNTQNFEKEMIISRRSTYQKILAMEKGAQVVERDSDLPVDVIINAAVCLVWYDSRNIGKKSTPRDEASSCLPLCVENIATNVLTMLSFAFSGCVLVFEGDMSFIAEIMESSDGIYAASASLGINLQLFYSYSSDLTDEIILNSIELATKSTRGLYPAMPESETLAESFLTQFPSINPLSAHAVLSSTGMLVEFLEWSHERRIRSIRKYHVPEESVSLLSALCRYGEREESKSGMTDCSSSVSSAPESEYCLYKTNSERKKQKSEFPIDASFQSEPLNPSRLSKQYHSGMSIGPGISSGTKRADLSWKGSVRAMTNKLNWHEISKSDVPHEDFVGEVIDFNDNSLFDADFSSILNSGMHSTMVNPEKKDPAARNLKTARRLSFGNNTIPTFPAAADNNQCSDLWNSVKDHKQNLNQDVIGYLDTDFNIDNMPLMHRKEVCGEGSKSNSADSFNVKPFHEKGVSHYDSVSWNPMQDHRCNLAKDATEYSDPDFNIDHTPLRHRRELSGEGLKRNSAKSYNESPFYQKSLPHYGETPLRNAICSSQLQHGSPWTIEFLNRIREKSRLRQQSLPCNLSSPGFGHSGNTSKFYKRKSPSILDFYKYKGGSAPNKIEQKRQKRSIQPSNSSKNEKTSVPFCPTWTPLDKRARQSMQTLSFATNGSGSQAKLVWK